MYDPILIIGTGRISLSEDQKEHLKSVFEKVEVGDQSLIAKYDMYKKIIIVDEGFVATVPIDSIFVLNAPSKGNGFLLISPNKFLYGIMKADSLNFENAYLKYGYTISNAPNTELRILEQSSSKKATNGLFKSRLSMRGKIFKPISTVEEIAKSIYNGTFLKNVRKDNLRRHLIIILTPILGSDTAEIVTRYENLFHQSFIHSSSNPIINYEILEAFGDKFLSGGFSWHLYDIPGIVIPDQVDKMSRFFETRYSLEKICDIFNLKPYIQMVGTEKELTKIKSDVIEALIAAIGIAWNKFYNSREEGNKAVIRFVAKIYETYFDIDPVNYKIKYDSPHTRFLELVSQKNLKTTSVKENIAFANGKTIVTISYENRVFGVGASRINNPKTAASEARKLAYTNAYQKLLSTLS